MLYYPQERAAAAKAAREKFARLRQAAAEAKARRKAARKAAAQRAVDLIMKRRLKVAEFIAQHFEVDGSSRIRSSTVVALYLAWPDAVLTPNELGRVLRELGFPLDEARKYRMYLRQRRSDGLRDR